MVNYFTSSMGYLLAGNHSLYWSGLRATVWPNFTWVDLSTDITGYENWCEPSCIHHMLLHGLLTSPAALHACMHA